MSTNAKEISNRVELRDRIIVKATEAFTLHGIKSITMDDIATSLGISKRTLYEVFEDKETLLREVILKNQEDKNEFLENLLAESTNVLEVILVCFQKSIEVFHQTNKRFFEDLKKYPHVFNMVKKNRDKDSESTIAFFKSVINALLRINQNVSYSYDCEQFDLLMNTDICKEYPFLEVYESIMFTFLRGIATERGARVLEEFIQEYRKNRIERTGE